MNSKAKILIGVLVVGIVLIGGLLIWNSQQAPIQLSKDITIQPKIIPGKVIVTFENNVTKENAYEIIWSYSEDYGGSLDEWNDELKVALVGHIYLGKEQEFISVIKKNANVKYAELDNMKREVELFGLDPLDFPDELRKCEIDSDCIMAGVFEQESSYGSLGCGCVNKKYKNRFRKCRLMIDCICKTYCKCVDKKCELEIENIE